MTESANSVVAYDPDHAARASEMDLVIPRIEIAHKLEGRLGRTDRTLEVDRFALWEGTQELELENKLLIAVDSLPKNERSNIPTLTYPEAGAFLLRINHKPDLDTDLTDKLNQAFWLGVLVSDALAEGEGGDKNSSMKDMFKSSMLSSATATVLGTNVAISESLHEPMAVKAGVLALGAAAVAKSTHLLLNSFRSSQERIARTQRKRAVELAKDHPVLAYGNTEIL